MLLVSLAKGRLGTETATLTGSLLVAAFWQAVLGRANVAPAARRPFFLFLDEFQDVVRLSESLPDLLAQARGFGIGAVLANQYLAQLPESVRAAVLGHGAEPSRVSRSSTTTRGCWSGGSRRAWRPMT